MFWISNTSLDGPSNLSVMLQLGKLNVSVIFHDDLRWLNVRHGGLRICIACETFAEYVCFLKRFQKQYLLSVK